MFLALALLLPMTGGHIQQFGRMILPMHIPVILCGFVCGWPWGLAVGLAAPLLSSTTGMPPLLPTGVAMSFELAAYGAFSGLLYRILPRKIPYIYISLILSMIIGRLISGAAQFIIAGIQNTTFTFAAFWAGAVTVAAPGIIIQIILIPILVAALRRAGVNLE